MTNITITRQDFYNQYTTALEQTEDQCQDANNKTRNKACCDILCTAAHYLPRSEYFYLLYQIGHCDLPQAMFLWLKELEDAFNAEEVDQGTVDKEMEAIRTYVADNFNEDQKRAYIQKLELDAFPAANILMI